MANVLIDADQVVRPDFGMGREMHYCIDCQSIGNLRGRYGYAHGAKVNPQFLKHKRGCVMNRLAAGDCDGS